jgi:hypothetical protein
MRETVHVSGRWLDTGSWEIRGLYTTEKEAIQRCATADDFVMSLPIGDAPEQHVVTGYFPHREDENPQMSPPFYEGESHGRFSQHVEGKTTGRYDKRGIDRSHE